jgi:hypothetical protein
VNCAAVRTPDGRIRYVQFGQETGPVALARTLTDQLKLAKGQEAAGRTISSQMGEPTEAARGDS